MASQRTCSVGDEMEQQLLDALRQADRAPMRGARDLPVLEGLTRTGAFTNPQENVLLRATEILASSRRVFVYGEGIHLEAGRLDGSGLHLTPLRAGQAVVGGAADLLANLTVCQQQDAQFAVPQWFAEVLLRCELLPPCLPRVRTYARRPVFDEHFRLLGPGWHEEAGVLVHGEDVEPAPFSPGDPSLTPAERLPPRLRALLADFCFRDGADLVNMVGLLLTGLLVTHFVRGGKPVALIDGNQPSLGKSLLASVAAAVLDGSQDVLLIRFTADDEELEKRICAQLRESTQSVLLIDNAKVPGGGEVNSTVIEKNSTAPVVSLRVLGKSEIFTRPNDLLWALTMNNTRSSPDLVARGLPIRLAYEGKPEGRSFRLEDPVAHALGHRQEVLGELAGMVVFWAQRGRPEGRRHHRFSRWAKVVGGILDVCGFPEFLANADEAAATFNTDLEKLGALAEAVVREGGPCRILGDPAGDEAGPTPSAPLAASQWGPYFQRAGVLADDIRAAASDHARAVRMGNFLTPNVRREVRIKVGEREGRATLQVEEARSRGKGYFFEVTWDPLPGAGPQPPPDPAAADGAAEAPPIEPTVAPGGGNNEEW